MIFDANADLGYEVSMFNMLGGNDNNFVSLGYFSKYNASFNLYYMYIVAEPSKIMWNTLLDFCLNFPMPFGFLKRALTFFSLIILMLSHCHVCESRAMAFDKLLHALTTSNLTNQVFSLRWIA